MMTSSKPFYDAKFSLLEFVPFKHRLRRATATQLLWSKLESDASMLMLSAERWDLAPQDKLCIEQCRQKLELAKGCIDRPVKRPIAFWAFIHEVDALLWRS